MKRLGEGKEWEEEVKEEVDKEEDGLVKVKEEGEKYRADELTYQRVWCFDEVFGEIDRKIETN